MSGLAMTLTSQQTSRTSRVTGATTGSADLDRSSMEVSGWCGGRAV
jgi:hypothetical protein